MGSALETLCGQAYGAGKFRMLGVYMQGFWIILLCMALIFVPIYVFSPPILEFFGLSAEIADAAGKFAVWMLPQLFAYALNFSIQKFLQAQRKVLVMAWVSAVLFYIFMWNSDGASTGFSSLAFADLLEFWYLMVLIVIAGHLKNPLVPVDAISICMNLNRWDLMIAIGFNAAKPAISSIEVAMDVNKLATLLGITVLLNSLQPVLSGVAIGAGWQSLVAFINIGCYYIVVLPTGILLGYLERDDCGICLQTIILVVVTSRTDWNGVASEAENRIRRWGGSAGEDRLANHCDA
ncbi:hypothetical protein HHK36_003153 [Tetracentron sinense]|uniref:Uncharacterized protein n=1 Tax=Tetracentron sinense TaxID=13715 RepID=A0A834ZNT2_TETSI|nr:hypothetical protein HHK36_003153 [Tetracentron sinense]